MEKKTKKISKLKKIALTACVTMAGLAFANRWFTYFSMDDYYGEKEYTQNTYYKPGELNEKPIKFCFGKGVGGVEFTDSQKQSIMNAINYFDENLDGVSFELCDLKQTKNLYERNITFFPLTKAGRTEYGYTGNSETPMGEDYIYSTIFINPNVTEVELFITVMHELGHAFKLDHSMKPGSLMSYDIIKWDYKSDFQTLNDMYPSK